MNYDIVIIEWEEQDKSLQDRHTSEPKIIGACIWNVSTTVTKLVYYTINVTMCAVCAVESEYVSLMYDSPQIRSHYARIR